MISEPTRADGISAITATLELSTRVSSSSSPGPGGRTSPPGPNPVADEFVRQWAATLKDAVEACDPEEIEAPFEDAIEALGEQIWLDHLTEMLTEWCGVETSCRSEIKSPYLLAGWDDVSLQIEDSMNTELDILFDRVRDMVRA